MKKLDHFLGEIAEANTPDDLAVLFAKQIQSLGFATFAYFNFAVPENDWVAHRHNYGLKWQDRYLDENYGEIDPVFQHGMRARLPFAWGSSDADGLTPRQVQMMHEARDCGLGNGFTVPNKTIGLKPSFISVASDETDAGFQSAIRHNAAELHILSLHFDAHFAELSLPQPIACVLTPRELEVMKWAKDGKTNGEISDILHISGKTVENHFTNIYNKLGVYSRTHAVVKCLTEGLIAP